MTSPYSNVAIIIGAMKAGTGSLFDALSQHPQICGAPIKEPEFFSEHQTDSSVFDDYLDVWPRFDPSRHLWRLEASTGYTKWPVEVGVAERMSELLSHPRLFYVVRDPIDRIKSHCAFVKLRTHEEVDPTDESVVQVSNYGRQLEPYVREFGRESISVVTLDDLKREPQQVLDRCFAHLELESIPVSVQARNVTSEQSTTRLHVWLSRYPRLRARLRAGLPAGVKASASRATRAALPTTAAVPPTISEALAAEIRGRLSADISRFGSEFGVDVAAWGF